MSDNCTAIIDKLIEQRHTKGMTQQDLAKSDLPYAIGHRQI